MGAEPHQEKLEATEEIVRRPYPITFIGPITEQKVGRNTIHVFHVLQYASGIIKLEYPDKSSAKTARDQLLKSNHTYKVPSDKLLQAIYEALTAISGEAP